MTSASKSVCSIHSQAYVNRCPYCVEPEAQPEERMIDLAPLYREAVPIEIDKSIWDLLGAKMPPPRRSARINYLVESAVAQRDAAAPEEDG